MNQAAEWRTIGEKEKSLNEAEKEAVNDINAANELLSDGATKLANSISSSAVDQQGGKVASLMIETAKENLEKIKTKLASVRDKQRMLSVKKKTYWKSFTWFAFQETLCSYSESNLQEKKLIRISWLMTVLCSIYSSLPGKEAISFLHCNTD